MNKAILVGRLTADPELKTTQSGISVCSFTVAVDRRYSANGERQADFINCVAWRKSAEFVSRYFSKGKLIGIEGSIQTRNYEDKSGNKRTAVEVVVDSLSFIGGKSESNSSAERVNNSAENDFEEIENSEEDLPF